MHSAPEANPEEAALVRKARWGDHDAFAQLYRMHAKAVHALAYRLTGNAAAAEDITQDTFLKMLGFLSGLRS
ncbi:MAG: RNA polymerase sigma factor, partial [Pseudoxanthomonas sp.]